MTAQEFEELDPDVKLYVGMICYELKKAMERYPEWPKVDFVHSAAIVNEESGELIRAALQYRYEAGPSMNMEKEAIQTGAMAIRFLLNR